MPFEEKEQVSGAAAGKDNRIPRHFAITNAIGRAEVGTKGAFLAAAQPRSRAGSVRAAVRLF